MNVPSSSLPFAHAAILAVAAMLTAGCSLTLELEECSTNNDCSQFGEHSRCSDAGLCLPTETVDPVISVDKTWTNDRIWVLDEMTWVVGGATLEIEPGTTIIGSNPEAGLVSRRGSRIEAEGTKDEPIVFTSWRDEGQRLPGDWAGLALIGYAETNRKPFELRAGTGEYGMPMVGHSDDEESLPAGDLDEWDCGTLRYVRVEFGGSEIEWEGGTDKALNGVTLAGCGSQTTVEYVQSHMSDDDGVVAFGGTVDLRNIVVTRAQNDGIGFDTGWRGTGQYLAVQQDAGGAEAIEIQNLFEDHEAEPQAAGRIYNYTVLGAEKDSDWQIGLYFKRGGKGHLSHGIVQGQPSAGLFIEGAVAADYVRNRDLTVRHTIFNDLGDDGHEGGEGYFDLIDIEQLDMDDEGDHTELTNHGEYPDYEGFLEEDYVEWFDDHSDANNMFGVDPDFRSDPYDLENPGWVPDPRHTAGSVPPPPSTQGFDSTGTFRGAFEPGTDEPWTDGWTAYPPN